VNPQEAQVYGAYADAMRALCAQSGQYKASAFVSLVTSKTAELTTALASARAYQQGAHDLASDVAASMDDYSPLPDRAPRQPYRALPAASRSAGTDIEVFTPTSASPLAAMLRKAASGTYGA
jgi:hypothetical protein